MLPPAAQVHRDGPLSMLFWRDVSIEVWHAPGGAAHFRKLGQMQRAWVARAPNRQFATIAVCQPASIRGVDAESRAVLTENSKQMAEATKASVIVLLGDGFGAALVRSIVAGLSLVRRTATPTKIVSAEEDGFRWVAPLLEPDGGRAVTPAFLQTLYDAVRTPESALRVGP
jgi:hypothetical protein